MFECATWRRAILVEHQHKSKSNTCTAGQEKNLAEVETRTFDFFNTRESLDSSDWKKYLSAAESLIPRHQNGVNFRPLTTPLPAAPHAHILSSLEPILEEALHARCLLSVSYLRRGKLAEFGGSPSVGFDSRRKLS